MKKYVTQGLFITFCFIYNVLIIGKFIESNVIVDFIMWIGFCIHFYHLIKGPKRWYREIMDVPSLFPLFLIDNDFIRYIIIICIIFDYLIDLIEDFLLNKPLIFVSLVFLITLFVGALGFKSFESLSWQDSLWVSFISATTVGYGDFYATTVYGRLTTVFVVLSGAILFSSILLAVVIDLIDKYKQRKSIELELDGSNFENVEYINLVFERFKKGEISINELQDKVIKEINKEDVNE